ncbi:MAG: GTP-binding protein [Lachnospiraceae bacterium]|nr:GTP-binding protein [Lachnospiraceae bacterium]
MTKVDIISGFLGAGKTTLIKKLIEESFKGQQVVLIENEFGEIGIDGGFLKDAGINITEMNSGCICCSLVGDFSAALKEVVEKYHPARIIIEPSGVGKLSDVARAVEKADAEELTVNSMVTVVDGNKAKMYMKNFGEFFNNQVETAGTIIISRSQTMKQEKLNDLNALLREHNKEAVIITTPWDELKGDQILSAMEKGHTLVDSLLQEIMSQPHEEHEHHHDHDHDHHHDHEEHEHHHDHDHEEHEHHHDHEHEHHHEEHDHDHDHDHEEHEHHHDHDHEEHEHHHDHDHEHHHHHHDHDADEVFQSWGEETANKYTEDEIRAILEKLKEGDEYGMVLRAKGYVPDKTEDSWIHFDLTPGEYEIRRGGADYTGRICVIGSGIKEDLLKELFNV